jgi:uncharacterized membrane protein
MGLTTLGIIHTAISLVAVFAGVVGFVRDLRINPKNRAGKTYIIMTVLTCLTGFGIYENGGFGAPHVLGIITLVVLWLAWKAGTTTMFGKASGYIETVGYSATFFFHMIPALTETTTRLPSGAPLIASREAPELQAAVGVCFLLFLVGAFFQVRRLRRRLPWPT